MHDGSPPCVVGNAAQLRIDSKLTAVASRDGT